MYSKFASFENIFKGKVVDLKDHNQFDLLASLGLLVRLVRVVLASGSTMAGGQSKWPMCVMEGGPLGHVVDG